MFAAGASQPQGFMSIHDIVNSGMSEIFGNSLGSQQGAHGDGRKEQLDVADRPWFNTVVVLLIILNAVLVGVEADQLQDSVAFFCSILHICTGLSRGDAHSTIPTWSRLLS